METLAAGTLNGDGFVVKGMREDVACRRVRWRDLLIANSLMGASDKARGSREDSVFWGVEAYDGI